MTKKCLSNEVSNENDYMYSCAVRCFDSRGPVFKVMYSSSVSPDVESGQAEMAPERRYDKRDARGEAPQVKTSSVNSTARSHSAM